MKQLPNGTLGLARSEKGVLSERTFEGCQNDFQLTPEEKRELTCFQSETLGLSTSCHLK